MSHKDLCRGFLEQPVKCNIDHSQLTLSVLQLVLSGVRRAIRVGKPFRHFAFAQSFFSQGTGPSEQWSMAPDRNTEYYYVLTRDF